jgi:hypothetical protein
MDRKPLQSIASQCWQKLYVCEADLRMVLLTYFVARSLLTNATPNDVGNLFWPIACDLHCATDMDPSELPTRYCIHAMACKLSNRGYFVLRCVGVLTG